MSGVTVATTIRSMSFAGTPDWSSAWWTAGRQMSESACSGAATRRSRMPVRSMIHSFVVSTIVDSSSFVITRSGAYAPKPVIETGRLPLAFAITAVLALHGERQRSARGQLAADLRGRAPPADRAADPLQRALELELIARLHDALEPHVVDPGKECDPATVLL